jgi:hypothetical protein
VVGQVYNGVSDRESSQLFQQIDADGLEALAARFAPTKQ